MSSDETLKFKDWLIESLKDKSETIAYLRVHLDQFEKGDPSMPGAQLLEIFRQALRNVLEAAK